MSTFRSQVDMSPNAITRRLQESSALWRMGILLSKAKYVGPVEPPKVAEAARRKLLREIENLEKAAQKQPTPTQSSVKTKSASGRVKK